MSNILLSTDIGSDIDDAIALLIMLNNPNIDMEGICTVNGNIQARSFIAKRMVDLAGRDDIFVCAGDANPLGSPAMPYSNLEEHLIDDVFLNEEQMDIDGGFRLIYKDLGEIGIITNGVECLGNKLKNNSYVVFSIGPMTTIARLMREFPEAAKNIERLYIMGCRTRSDAPEHNIRYDSVAASEVLRADIPTVIIPSELCKGYEMPYEYSTLMVSKVAKYVRSMLNGFVGGRIITEVRSHSGIYEFLSLTEPLNHQVAEELIWEMTFVESFVNNFDHESAFIERDDFLSDYFKLIEILRGSDLKYNQGSPLAKCLQIIFNMSKNVWLADAFVPYCYLFPEKVRFKEMTLDCDFEGRTTVSEGKKHLVATELDYKDFDLFVKQNIT